MIRLGSTVRDMVSGFQGIACATTDYMNGNVQIGIQPKVGDNNLYPEPINFDVQTVEFLDPGISDNASAPDSAALAFRLGTKARDLVTGVEGILTSRTTFLNGCVHYLIRPRAGEYGKEYDGGISVDWNRVEYVNDGILPKIAPETVKKGGLLGGLFGKKDAPASPPNKKVTGGPATRLVRAS